MLQKFVFHSERKDGNPVDAPFDHPADGEFHAFGIVNGRSEKNLVILFNGQRFERLHDFGEEGVGDLGDDQPKYAAASRDQCPRLAVRVISKLGNGLPNAFCQLRIDGRYLIDRARYCCCRYFGSSGNIPDVHESSFTFSKDGKLQYTLSQIPHNPMSRSRKTSGEHIKNIPPCFKRSSKRPFQVVRGMAKRDAKGPCIAGIVVVNVYLSCPAISVLAGVSRG